MSQLENRDECQLFLMLNKPNEIEKNIAHCFAKENPEFIIPHSIDFRETIGASTNRGYLLADTDFLSYTDVDDMRPADAYIHLLQILEKNPDIDFTYGDFVIVPKQGDIHGRLVETIAFDPYEFKRGTFVSPGHCFRRSLLNRCGFWDEQLLSGGDFDFQVRAAFHGKFKKTPQIVLFYTLDGTVSASSTSWQAIDALTICLRYGIYDKLGHYLNHLPETSSYRINEILQRGEWHSVSEFVPNYANFLSECRPLISKSMKGMSFQWTRSQLRSFFISCLERMNLLKHLKALRDKYRKSREAG